MATHLYETLNLSRNASPDEIRKAYKKLALRTHPDRAPPERKQQAEEEFRKVNAAYEVLIDEEKREIYDRHGVYPPPEPAVENVYANPFSQPQSHGPRFQPPPTFARPSFERQSRRHYPPRSADPFGQMFNESPFSAAAPPGSGPFGMHHIFFTDPFKLFHDVFASAFPPHHFVPPTMGLNPMFPIVGGPDFIVDSDHIQPFRSSNSNVIWTEETRTTKIINGREETICTRIDQDGNVRRTYDINGKRWETFNDQVVRPPETDHDAHHERIDYAPPPSSHSRPHKSSAGKKSRHASPGYSYVSATPQPPPPQPPLHHHHTRTTSTHIPGRRPFRRMHSYSQEDFGAPLNDTENIRPYSYEFAPREPPQYEEYHYPTSSREQHTKRRYEQAPPTPPRDPDVTHRRVMRPDGSYKMVHGDREPEPTFIPPNPEHEVKEKRWWQKFTG